MKGLKSGKHLYAIYYEYSSGEFLDGFLQIKKTIIFVRRVKDFDKSKAIRYYIQKIY